MWARREGIHYQTAWKWWKQGTLPVPARQAPTGMILVDQPEEPEAGGVRLGLYGRRSARRWAERALDAAQSAA